MYETSDREASPGSRRRGRCSQPSLDPADAHADKASRLESHATAAAIASAITVTGTAVSSIQLGGGTLRSSSQDGSSGCTTTRLGPNSHTSPLGCTVCSAPCSRDPSSYRPTPRLRSLHKDHHWSSRLRQAQCRRRRPDRIHRRQLSVSGTHPHCRPPARGYTVATTGDEQQLRTCRHRMQPLPAGCALASAGCRRRTWRPTMSLSRSWRGLVSG